MRSDLESRISTLEVSRKSERTGRIRAEMKLRTLLKRREGGGVDDYGGFAAAPGGGGDDRGDDDDIGDDDDDYGDAAAERPLLLRRIGRMRSPYAKRMGTPRQGSLVPSGRGYVQLDVPMECVSGLDGYSHAWIIFSFHANTDAPASPRGGGGGGGGIATPTLALPLRGRVCRRRRCDLPGGTASGWGCSRPVAPTVRTTSASASSGYRTSTSGRNDFT
jgi:hypothetical protein